MNQSTNTVSIKNLEYYFGHGGSKQHVLKNIELDLASGEIVLLTGPSGSGKTTLVSLIAALRRPQAGSIKVFGSDLNGASEQILLNTRRNIGYIFQQHNLLKFLTAKQNVILSLALQKGLKQDEMKRRACEILAAIGMADRLDYFPDQLSGGQKQKVAVARALVTNPKLVIADEPS